MQVLRIWAVIPLLAMVAAATCPAQNATSAAQPSTLSAAAAPIAPPTPKVDPDLLLHIGIAAGKVKGANFTDATGKVAGKIVGNPMKSALGPGQGMRFNGSTDWLLVAENGLTTGAGLPTRDFTVSAWVAIHQATEYGSIIGCAQDNGDAETGWILGYTKDAFTFALSSAGVTDDQDGRLTYVKAKAPMALNTWYHVAATYDGRAMKLYVNGQLEGESRVQSGDIRYPTAAPYTIGCYKDDDEQFPMNGTLLEIRVLGRALTPAQIVEEFTPGVRLTNWQPELEKDQRFVVKPYLQAATTDGMTIMWETSRPGLGWVEYGERLPYSQKSAMPTKPGTMHEVRLTGLTAQTNYFYRVHTIDEDGKDLVGDELTFQTAVRPDSPYAFVVIGDTQKNKPVIEKLQAFAYTLRPNFEIHLGDVVDKGADKSEWTSELLEASWPLMSRVCMFPSIGNHEENHSLYYQYFSLPDPEFMYTYTYGNAQFFVLDTNKPVDTSSEQYAWLERELAKSKATWKFVYHHHPVVSSDENDYGDLYKTTSQFGDTKLKDLAPLFEKYGVDIDFNGHIHSYERTWPIVWRGPGEESRVDLVKGVRYITSGGGGGGLESAGPSRAWFDQRVFRGHHICYLAIHDRTLQFQMFDLEGRLFDQMEIRK